MQYRVLGKTGVQVSALGFGAMRLPITTGPNDVDQATAIAMIRRAIDGGVNYIDTAWPYHGGRGEAVVGRALAEGYRDRVHLATKLPVWEVKGLADCDRIFTEQLRRLQTDRIDFYLLHCVQKPFWPKLRDLGVLDWAERLKREGRITHFGFSFHDTFDVFQEVVDGYDWDFCQLQYNYVCEDVQAGTRGLEYAAARGLGVIVMEPLFGGTLASPPPSVAAIWAAAGADPVDSAFQWLWNKPAVHLVLSGMSAPEQVEANLAIAARARVGSLTPVQFELIARVRAEYERLNPVPCTKCGYCLPCPHGINIPANFELSNQASVLQGNSALLCRNLYLSLSAPARAAACQECHLCEERCPQHIPIPEKLALVAAQFANPPAT